MCMAPHVVFQSTFAVKREAPASSRSVRFLFSQLFKQQQTGNHFWKVLTFLVGVEAITSVHVPFARTYDHT